MIENNSAQQKKNWCNIFHKTMSKKSKHHATRRRMTRKVEKWRVEKKGCVRTLMNEPIKGENEKHL